MQMTKHNKSQKTDLIKYKLHKFDDAKHFE